MTKQQELIPLGSTPFPLLLAGQQRNRSLVQSLLFENSGPSGLIRTALLLVFLAVAAFFAWAAYFTIDEVAHVSGQVISSAPVQRIQHLEGGIVQEILVQDRAVVRQGQVLVRLEPQAAETALNQLRTDRLVLLAWQVRLKAFLDDSTADFSAILAEGEGYSNQLDMRKVIQSQEHLLHAQRQARQSQRALLQTKAERFQTEVDTVSAQRIFLEKRIRLAKEQQSVHEDGLAKGATSRLDVVFAEQRVNDAQSESMQNKGLLTKAQQERQEALQELAKREDDVREQTLRELGKVTAELSKLEEGMDEIKDRVARLEVRSPVDGIIQDMPVKTVRGVLAPGALIAEIIPIGLVRFLEVKISTLDVGHVVLGQLVSVNVLAYDFARYGGLDGSLESISPTTFLESEGVEPYYKGIIRLHKNYVGNQPSINEVLPGMVVQADIHTGSKTLMEYLLKPIYASVDRAFRER